MNWWGGIALLLITPVSGLFYKNSRLCSLSAIVEQQWSVCGHISVVCIVFVCLCIQMKIYISCTGLFPFKVPLRNKLTAVRWGNINEANTFCLMHFSFPVLSASSGTNTLKQPGYFATDSRQRSAKVGWVFNPPCSVCSNKVVLPDLSSHSGLNEDEHFPQKRKYHSLLFKLSTVFFHCRDSESHDTCDQPGHVHVLGDIPLVRNGNYGELKNVTTCHRVDTHMSVCVIGLLCLYLPRKRTL